MPSERGTALAIVRTTRSGDRLLRHCAVHPASEIRAEHVLAPLNHSRELSHARISAVLSAEDYHLVQVEAPDVQPAEMRGAVRWKLRDVIDFPVADAVVDVFDIPQKGRYVETRTVFAVAARAEAVARLVKLVKPQGRGFDVIDIPELCLRNLSALLPQDQRGIAFLALATSFAYLVLTCQGVLFLSRRIELAQRPERLSLEPSSDTDPLAIEIRRSLDYYESHFDREPIEDLVIASGDERAQRLLERLATQTGLKVTVFDPKEVFEVEGGIEPDTHFPGLIALGAALRTDRAP